MSASNRQDVFCCGRFRFELGRKTYVMGILNVTPDSFSDGGRYNDPLVAASHAAEMIRHGADIVDIGGESTRPGFDPVDDDVEINRVVPVIEQLVRQFDCPISIDTTKAAVADAAIRAGACIINDVNGLRTGPDLADVAQRHAAGLIVMHNARLAQADLDEGTDVFAGIKAFLTESIRTAVSAGVGRSHLMIDPGIGFGISHEASIDMIARLDELDKFGLPILIGPSRKRFINHILGQDGDRDTGTLAAVAIGIARGADFVRVHKVKPAVEAARVTDALIRRQISEGGGKS